MANPSRVFDSDGPASGLSVLVAGGTGNVGRHIVRALLERGATVVVPSRSREKLDVLVETLGAHGLTVGPAGERLVTIVGDVSDEQDAARVRDEVERMVPSPLHAVVASLGQWISAPSLLGATRAQLVTAIENYAVAHFVVARTFLPAVAERSGSYTFINGPSARSTWPGSGLVSVATAAQAMLAQAITDEYNPDGGVRITELVIHPSAFIGPDALRDGGGPIDGEAVGRYVAALVSGRVRGGPTLHLESAEQLAGLP